jgi:hypothetical protein
MKYSFSLELEIDNEIEKYRVVDGVLYGELSKYNQRLKQQTPAVSRTPILNSNLRERVILN